MGDAILRMVNYQAITQNASPAVALITSNVTVKEHLNQEQLPGGLKSWHLAALSNARLPTLQSAVEQEANMEDGPLVTGTVSGLEVTFLVNTGVDITNVKRKVLNKIEASKHSRLEEVETSMLIADGSSLSFLGWGRFSIP